MMHYKIIPCALFALLLLSACAPAVTHPAPLAALPADAADAEYRIGVGDELDIKFFAAPEMNETQQVRPDGKISLMFAQDIDAAGKTPQELAADIRKKIYRHVPHADLVVVVRNFASQKAYVGGEVAKPGPVPLTGRETLLQLLDDAGWATPAARLDEVLLLRADAQGREAVYPVDLSKAIRGEDMAQNILVQRGDIVLVPPSGPVAFDRWMEQNIRQALPFNMGASYIFTNQVNGGVLR